jgi:hypothetical protein
MKTRKTIDYTKNESLNRMTGMFQTSFYFGYTAILSLGMFCMLGKQ